MSSGQAPKVFLIILNWNGWADTLRCLESLRELSITGEQGRATLRQVYSERSRTAQGSGRVPSTGSGQGNYQLSMIIVDNGSTDGSAQQLKAYSLQPTAPRFELIQNAENLGFAGGNNVGIQYALDRGADYICLLNNDTLVEPDFLEKLIAVGERHKNIGMLNPKILMINDQLSIHDAGRFWWIGGRINWLHTRGWHPYYTEEDRGQFDENEFFETDYCTGCCVLVKREVIEKIGLMPEEYFLYYEDADWSLKARRAGFQCVVVPSAAIWHEGAAANKEGSPKYIRYHVRNGLMLALRTGNIIQILCAYFMTIPRAKWQIIKWIIFPSKRSWAKAIMLGIWDAWMGRAGQLRN